MLSRFEKQTEPLDDYEHNVLLPLVVQGLKLRVGEKLAVTNKEITEGMRLHGYKIGEARVRKIINHIRTNALVKRLVATSKGYYIATDLDDLGDYIGTLRGREDAIREVRECMERQYAEWKSNGDVIE